MLDELQMSLASARVYVPEELVTDLVLRCDREPTHLISELLTGLSPTSLASMDPEIVSNAVALMRDFMQEDTAQKVLSRWLRRHENDDLDKLIKSEPYDGSK